MRQNFDHPAEALHEALQVELVAGEVEFDAGPPGIARQQRDSATRHRLEQGGCQICDLEAQRAPGRLALHIDVHVGPRRARKAGRIAERSHRMRPYQFGLSSIPMLKQTDEYDGMVGEVFPDAGQIRAHLDAELAQVPGRPDARPHQEHG